MADDGNVDYYMKAVGVDDLFRKSELIKIVF